MIYSLLSIILMLGLVALIFIILYYLATRRGKNAEEEKAD